VEKLEKDERRRLVRAAMKRLSFEHREVIVLKNFENLSYREMSEVLEVPMGTIMSRLCYARKALKEIIEKWEGEGAPGDARRYPKGEVMPGEVS